MKKQHLLKKLKKELETENKLRPKSDFGTFFNLILLVMSFIIFMTIMINDSQIYFYQNYFLYSIFGLLFYSFIFLYLLPKGNGQKVFSQGYYISMLIIGISIFIYIVPKAWHYNFLKLDTVCFQAKLTYKYYSYTSGEVGRISFDSIYEENIPYKIIQLSSLSAIPKDEYDSLPNIGSKIKICGDISKVGYTYTHIETIKE